MAQYIEKSTLVAEIARQKAQWRICKSSEAKYRREMLDDISSFLDTLEVKDLQEEPVSKEIGDYDHKAVMESLHPELKEESVSEDLEQKALSLFPVVMADKPFTELDLNEEKRRIYKAGANWQKEQDKETIELAEDHAMLAGIIKGTEHTIGKVRSILNKVAYRNNGLDVNGDYCEQPYVELDNEFRKLFKED